MLGKHFLGLPQVYFHCFRCPLGVTGLYEREDAGVHRDPILGCPPYMVRLQHARDDGLHQGFEHEGK